MQEDLDDLAMCEIIEDLPTSSRHIPESTVTRDEDSSPVEYGHEHNVESIW